MQPVSPIADHPIRSAARWLFLAALAGLFPVIAQDLPVVLTQEVEKGRIERVLRQAATLHPYEEVFVYARASGYAREVRADMGDRVESGDVLAVLDLPELEAELEAAEASVKTGEARVKSAAATLALKRAGYELTKSLFEKGGRTRFQLDEAQAGLELAAADLDLARALGDEAKARLKKIQAALSFGHVRSPFRGVVIRRLVDTGALVKGGTAGDSKPLFIVQRTDKLRCRVEIPERDVVLVLQAFERKRLEIQLVMDALPGEPFQLGPEQMTRESVRFASEVHPESHHMLAEIDIGNRDGALLPGLFGRVTLMARGVGGGVGEEVALVANTAIRAPRTGRPFVFVVKEQEGRSTLEERSVELGLTDGTRTEIMSGLQPGERVVVRGSGGLAAGHDVTAVSGPSSDERSEGKP
ncbi:MAG: efflux RND transporter periplasmic adaptor subunit [Planctomycetota bacterium]